MGEKLLMMGKRFGRLTVVAEGEKSKNSRQARWICQCDCGNITPPIDGYDLRNGHTSSCGCLHKERTAKAKTIHGGSYSRLYHIWQNMKARCKNPKTRFYKDYGGRGIAICQEWAEGFEAFEKWAFENGYADNLTIDRIDNDGNYCPENCRWVESEVQANNTRKNVFATINGRTQTLSQWAKETGVSDSTIRWRYSHGVSGEGLIQPPHQGRKLYG